MKNYWLEKKQHLNQKYSELKVISAKSSAGKTNQIDFMFENGHTFTCTTKEGGLFTKMGGKKKKETLQVIEAEFQFVENFSKQLLFKQE